MQTNYNIANSLGLVQTFWGPMFEKELRQNTLWVSTLLDPNYTMDSVKGGSTVKISRINKPTSAIRTIGTNADVYDTNVLSSTQVDLVVNKRCVSAFEFEDLAVLMSQLEMEDSEIRQALLADVQQQANDWVKSLINPSAAAPDHVINGVTDFNATQLAVTRLLASQAKWVSSGQPYYLFADPSYIADMLKDSTVSNAQVMGNGLASPAIEGRFVDKRFGFNIIEDDSLSTDTAYAFIPSFMKVIAGVPRFKVSDLHANKQFGYVLSVDFPIGAVQLDNARVIKTYNA